REAVGVGQRVGGRDLAAARTSGASASGRHHQRVRPAQRDQLRRVVLGHSCWSATAPGDAAPGRILNRAALSLDTEEAESAERMKPQRHRDTETQRTLCLMTSRLIYPV